MDAIKIKTVLHIPYLDQHEIRQHGLEGSAIILSLINLETGRRYIKICRGQAGQCIVVKFRNRKERDFLQLQLTCELNNQRRLPGKGHKDEQIILRQIQRDDIKLFLSRYFINQYVVIEKKALQFLHYIALDITRGKGKHTICLMDQTAGRIKIALENLCRCLRIKFP